jgi:hypothetical protein
MKNYSIAQVSKIKLLTALKEIFKKPKISMQILERWFKDDLILRQTRLLFVEQSGLSF